MAFVLLGGLHAWAAQPQQTLTPLEASVRHELVMLPYHSIFDNLEFQVEGGQVTLSGQVVRPTLKKAAERVVAKLPNVQSVVNNIEVLPASPYDSQIRLAVYRAIYRNPNFVRYANRALPPIHIIVNRGNVTLVGAVGSEIDRVIAGMRASSVPFVFEVDNRLAVS
ncbi:MAG: BON domain-containing protein [Acidobacteriota bacterium]|nr:MAG: BON domain-containing protein [Acidobacteriota bacterium]